MAGLLWQYINLGRSQRRRPRLEILHGDIQLSLGGIGRSLHDCKSVFILLGRSTDVAEDGLSIRMVPSPLAVVGTSL